MNDPIDDPIDDPKDAELHELFAGIRGQVATVVEAFASRVMDRVEATEQAERPGWGGTISAIMVEALNLFATVSTPSESSEAAEPAEDSEPAEPAEPDKPGDSDDP